jgi:hypothetical protein
LAKQAQMGLERPSELYVDGAYISAGSITEAKEEGWNLMRPAQPSASRAERDKAYRIEAFDVNITERKAVCPQGKTSTECSKLTERDSGKVTYRFEFGRQCRDCSARSLCVPRCRCNKETGSKARSANSFAVTDCAALAIRALQRWICKTN